jgi:hypothetical protein
MSSTSKKHDLAVEEPVGKKAKLSPPKVLFSNESVSVEKGQLVGEMYNILIAAGFTIGYKNRAGILFLPVLNGNELVLACSSCSKTTKGKRTHCPVSLFQFLKLDGKFLHVYTQCGKGIANNNATNDKVRSLHHLQPSFSIEIDGFVGWFWTILSYTITLYNLC